MNAEDRLRKAIESGEVLKIIYHGGSQPGSLREIAPISLKNGRVSARCLTTSTVKTFVVDNIVVFDGDVQPSAEEYQSGSTSLTQYASIIEILERQKDALVLLGWHINYEKHHISLHRKYKSGKPQKGSDVSLDYKECTNDLVAGLDGKVYAENERLRLRPWTVRGKNQHTKTYSRLDNAAETFIEWSKLMAPHVHRGQGNQ